MRRLRPRNHVAEPEELVTSGRHDNSIRFSCHLFSLRTRDASSLTDVSRSVLTTDEFKSSTKYTEIDSPRESGFNTDVYRSFDWDPWMIQVSMTTVLELFFRITSPPLRHSEA